MKIFLNRLVSGVEDGDVLSDDHINAADKLFFNSKYSGQGLCSPVLG